MKTKDFIKMLQEEDPSGEGYLRFNGDAPLYVEAKEGYWDGPYKYYDKEKELLVYTTAGYKVDVGCIDEFDIVWEYGGNLEKVKDHIKVELGYVSDERTINFWNGIEEECIRAKKFQEDSLKKWIKDVCRQYYDGDFIIQKKNENGEYKLWMSDFMWDCDRRCSICGGELDVIRERSDIFDIEEKENFRIYRMKKNIIKQEINKDVIEKKIDDKKWWQIFKK